MGEFQENRKRMNCTVCGSELIPQLSEVRDPLTEETFSIARCPGCGLGHTVPQPENLTPYYAFPYYGNRHGFTLRRCIKRRLAFVHSVVQPGSSQRLLDIGCGDGSFLWAAKKMGWEVMGTELNPQPARDSGLDVRAGIEQVDQEGQFDCVTMWHTLEHMRDVKSTLIQIGTLLKTDGRLIIAVPDNGGFQAKIFGRKWLHLDVPRHLVHFDANSLAYCLRSAGFSIDRQWHQEFEYDLLGWSQSALNCIIPYPNVFFDVLTGKRKKHEIWVTVSGFVLATVLTVLAVPLVAAGTLAGRGGTIVVAAYRAREQHRA